MPSCPRLPLLLVVFLWGRYHSSVYLYIHLHPYTCICVYISMELCNFILDHFQPCRKVATVLRRTHMYLFISVYFFIYLSSICLSIYLPIYLSFYLPTYLSIYQTVNSHWYFHFSPYYRIYSCIPHFHIYTYFPCQWEAWLPLPSIYLLICSILCI